MIHFLHIGKTGGTALAHALQEVEQSTYGTIKFHDHTTRLCDIPLGEKVIFFLREPLARFYSSFYSRKRKGKPRYDSQWTDDETVAFKLFASPDLILDYAISGDNLQRQQANHALTSIGHIKDHFTYWLDSVEYLDQRKDDILYVGNLESFDSDFEKIKSLLGLPDQIKLPTSEIESHKNPSYERTELTSAQTAFFQGWFWFDYNIYDFLNTSFNTTDSN